MAGSVCLAVCVFGCECVSGCVCVWLCVLGLAGAEVVFKCGWDSFLMTEDADVKYDSLSQVGWTDLSFPPKMGGACFTHV